MNKQRNPYRRAAAILLQHNRWRRDTHVPNARRMPHPLDIGWAIALAIGVLKEKGEEIKNY